MNQVSKTEIQAGKKKETKHTDLKDPHSRSGRERDAVANWEKPQQTTEGG